MFSILNMTKGSTRVNRATLALNVNLCVIVITEMDVIKQPEYVTMGSVPMDGAEKIVDRV